MAIRVSWGHMEPPFWGEGEVSDGTVRKSDGDHCAICNQWRSNGMGRVGKGQGAPSEGAPEFQANLKKCYSKIKTSVTHTYNVLLQHPHFGLNASLGSLT